MQSGEVTITNNHQCDLGYPACSACVTASASCLGFDSVYGNETPRSTVSHLEDEVARLEVELLRVKSQSRGISDITNAVVERLAMRLATSSLEPQGGSNKRESVLSLTSTYFISSSPSPWLNSQAWDATKARKAPDSLPGAITISTIPRNVVNLMLRHYCEIYRPLYPAIKESDLYKACDKVYDNTQPSDFDKFCVHITLAISVRAALISDMS
jgi:hypothetical protein